MKVRRRSSSRGVAVVVAASPALFLCFLLTAPSQVLGDGVSDAKPDAKCEDISKLLPSEDACAFAKLNCDTGSLIPYPELYYCLAKPAGFPAAALATLLTSVVLVALFRALSATAEDYFTPAMTQASAAVRMPPRLAGATLLALGNGAPDIGAAVAATRSGALELAAGALLGSGLFIGCVVAGAVVRAAGGVPARGALLRDVCGYGIAVLGAVLVLSRGGGRGGGGAGGGEAAAATTAGAGSAAFLLLLYLCYVLAVAGADAAKIIKDAQGYDDDDEIESGGGGRASSAPLLAPASAFWAPPEADLPLSAAPAPALLHQATAHPNSHHHRLPLAPQHVAAAAEELEMTLSDMSMTPMAGGGRGGRGGGGGEGREGGSSPPRSERTTVSDGRASSSGVGVGGDFSNDDEQAEESNKRVHDDSSSSSRTLASATASSHDQLQPRGDLFAASGSPPVAPDTGPSAGTSLGRRRARPRALTLFGGGGGGGEAGPAAAAGAGPPPLSSRLLACLRVLDAPLTVSRAMTIPVLPGGGGGGGGGEGGEGGGGEGEGEEGEDEPAGASGWLPVALLLGPPAAALRLSPWSPSRSPLRFGVSLSLGAFAGAVASVACLVARGRSSGSGGGRGASGAGGGGGGGEEENYRHSPLLLFVPLPRGAATSRRIRKLSSAAVRAFSLLAAALWVDSLASELVGAATLVGAVSGAPPALVGGTLLAWGNSAGDLVTNVAIAKRGLPNMALTACYASPLANLLLGLGVGIGVAAASGSPVRLPPGGVPEEVAAAAGWAWAMVLAVLVVAFLGKRRLPSASSWALLGVYVCYVASGLASAAAAGGGTG